MELPRRLLTLEKAQHCKSVSAVLKRPADYDAATSVEVMECINRFQHEGWPKELNNILPGIAITYPASSSIYAWRLRFWLSPDFDWMVALDEMIKNCNAELEVNHSKFTFTLVFGGAKLVAKARLKSMIDILMCAAILIWDKAE